MKKIPFSVARRCLAMLLLLATQRSGATGLATCDSEPRSQWRTQEVLEKKLIERGWKVRRIKEDGGCFEVYALNDKGERVEAYFHPHTLAPVPTKPR